MARSADQPLHPANLVIATWLPACSRTLPIPRELARHGIRVLAVAPGIMETPMLKGMPTEVQDALGKMVPFPARLGRLPQRRDDSP